MDRSIRPLPMSVCSELSNLRVEARKGLYVVFVHDDDFNNPFVVLIALLRNFTAQLRSNQCINELKINKLHTFTTFHFNLSHSLLNGIVLFLAKTEQHNRYLSLAMYMNSLIFTSSAKKDYIILNIENCHLSIQYKGKLTSCFLLISIK